MQSILKLAGAEQKYVVLILDQKNLQSSHHLEDITNLLSLGEIPNLFSNEQKVKVIEDMSSVISGTLN